MEDNPSYLFAEIIESFPTSVVLVDHKGTIRLVNNETLSIFGYLRDELVGKSFDLLITESLRNKHSKYVSDYKLNPSARIMGKGREVKALRKDSSEVPVEVGLRPVQTEKGLYVLCVIIDITDRIARDIKIKELEETRNKFLMNITHDFLTPLTLITGPLNEIIANAEDSKILDNAHLIRRNTKILQRLITQLLDISGLDFSINLRVGFGSVEKIFKKVSNSFTDIMRNKKINFEIRSKNITDNCFFDNDVLEKIVINVFNITTNLTRENGDAKITYEYALREKNPETLKISAYLMGDVISPVNIIKIQQNELFFEEDTDVHISRDFAHTRGLTAVHKGKLEIFSLPHNQILIEVKIAVSKDVFLPGELLDSQSYEENNSAGEDVAFHPVKDTVIEDNDSLNLVEEADRKIVLVIEDNVDMQHFIRLILESGSYKVYQAFNGREGLEKAFELIPDIVLSDVMMPTISGYEVCSELKTDIRTIHIPVILLTAKFETDSRIEGLRSGADDYLSKPFNGRELLIRMENLIKSREVLKRHFREMVVIKPSEITTNSMDEKFLQKIMDIIELNLENDSFSVDELADQMFISQSQLYRKLIALTGYSTSSFIQTVRLKKAAEMIQKKIGNIADISFKVGFNSPAYFSKCFKSHFGCTPRQYFDKCSS